MKKWKRILHNLRLLGRQETGSQLAEVAIALPVMLVLFAAVAEFGRFFYTDLTLGKATRAGARYLSAKQLTATEINNAKSLVICGDPTVNSICDKPVADGLTPAMIKITPESGIPNTIKVEIQNYEFKPLFDLGAMAHSDLSLKVNISPKTTMKYLLN
jgi:Flp pilus assembly protein TadG